MTMIAGAGPRLRCGGLQLGAGGLQLRDEPLLHLRQPARLRGLHQRTPGRQARGGPQLLELSTFNKEKEKNNGLIIVLGVFQLRAYYMSEFGRKAKLALHCITSKVCII